ncbi:NAD-dependent epimerase/dehydratase family protein [archaeon]|jgi:UDP-glucose 4-epimerase|nr:NAD-dependent epimerase/dehydratase family protein [archaeon]MBT4350975.1 NAD-dependent epimerase/dehydratase family protein [archaeon]MBT4647666.1 NAD-dependent epimerase/dehydratase family protein [archaeon]MBT6822219.1 NAD-dependent epimerase/dehydratase family protein [archaeon]MBT7391486.1 NAD-dependent epimerase/dehydratase family protein [archaeon]
MKFLVTGGAGFIASHVVDKLIDEGHEVVIIDNLSSGKKKNLNPKAKFYKIDIRDKKIENIFKKEKPDIVNHHAAQLDVRVSVDRPEYDADINLMGLLNVLNNCVKYNVKKIIYVSSGGVVYGDNQNFPLKEDEPKAPISPYGITKWTGEMYLQFYSNIHKLKYTALRYSNVYGPRQDPHGEAGVVAIFSRKMINNEDIVIFGDGTQSRDFVFVKDVVNANILSINNGDNEAFNIGTSETTSVNKLFKILKSISGFKKDKENTPSRPGELQKNCISNKKAKKLLGWKPTYSLEEGLKITFDWIKEN